MGDSGRLAYNNTGKKNNGTTLDHMLKSWQLKCPWPNVEALSGSGWYAREWLVGIKAFIKANEKFRTPDGDG
eukprot:3106499-Heterocapsa_arctica.AAC.1